MINCESIQMYRDFPWPSFPGNISIGSVNGAASLGTKPLPDPMLTQIFDNTWYLWTTVCMDLLLIIVFLVHVALCYRNTWFIHYDVIKWKHFPRYWPFVRGIHQSPVNSPHKGQWRGASMFFFDRAWINGSVNNRVVGNLRRHRAHCDVTVTFLYLW